MPEDLDTPVWRRALEKAAERPFFVASALRAYQTRHGLGDDELATFLGCARQDLPKLALCGRPEVGSAKFRADVEQIARYVGAEVQPLAQLFCEAATLTTFDSAPAAPGGFLIAARDRPEEKPKEDKE